MPEISYDFVAQCFEGLFANIPRASVDTTFLKGRFHPLWALSATTHEVLN